MASRAFAFLIWAVVAASVVFWMLRLTSSSQPVPAHAVAVGDVAMARGDLSRLFGRESAPAALGPMPAAGGSPLKLVGVVAPRADSGIRAGVALISVEGKPARPYRVGATVESDLVLLAVHQRGASLGPRDGTATVKLELPTLPPPATGTLSGTAVTGDPGTPPPPAPVPRTPRMRLPPPVEAPGADAPQPPADAEPEPQPEPNTRPSQS